MDENGKGHGEGRDQGGNGKDNSSDGGTGSVEAATLMSEVTSLLKSMRTGGKPQVSAVRLQRLDTTGQKTVLLDGGATHCLRPMRSEEEWEKAVETPVFLASGTVTLRQVPGSETLITRDKGTQPIVPLASLVQLGIQVNWNEQGCEMKRPDGSKLPIYLDGGCPVMERWQGMDLMAEVEFFNSQKFGIRNVIATRRLDAARGWCSEKQARQALEIATLFPQVPAHLAAEIPGDNMVDMEKVPLNRRQRKRIAEAKSLVVHLFSGKQTSLWTSCEREGHVVLCVELQKGLDMHNRALVSYLEDLFRSGKVDMLLAGPPCRSVSLSRFRDDDGPPPIRGRDGMTRFGLPIISWANKQLCDQDSLLWLRLLWFCYVGRQANVDMEIGIEQPSDPEEFLPETRLRPQYGFPSFLSWPETFTIIETCSLTRIRFDQGALGHPHKKPTEMLSSIPEVHALDGMRITLGQEMERWSEDLGDRLQQAKAAAAWARGLVAILQIAIRRKQDEVSRQGRREVPQGTRTVGSLGPVVVSSEPIDPVARSSSALRALNAKDAAELLDWKRHVEMGHQPYRRDCMVCVQSQGRDRQRRRIPTPESYALSVDMAGPFNPGSFQEQGSFRYFMVGTFTIPVKNGLPLADGLAACCGKKDEERGENPNQERGESGVPIDHLGDGSACQSDRCCVKSSEWPEDTPDPMEEKPQQHEEPLDEVAINMPDAANQKWMETVKDLQDFEVKHLTFVIPMKTRHATEIIKGLAVIHARLSALNLPLVRLHTDRAKEFVSRQLQEWTRARCIWHTTSAGDEAQGNSRAEAEINIIKNRVRTVMAASKAPNHFWPLAAYHCGEERHRSQLQTFGIRLPPMVPFGTKAMAKTKRWHKRIEDDPGWSKPMQKIQVWGPAWQMSPSSRGYYVEADGKFLRTTVVVQCVEPPADLQPQIPEENTVDELFRAAGIGDEYEPTDDEEALQDLFQEAADDDKEVVVQSVPEDVRDFATSQPVRRRLHGKQYVPPVLRLLCTGGEWAYSLDGEKAMEEDYKMMDWQDKEQWQTWETLVHLGLRKAMLEEKGFMDFLEVGGLVKALDDEATQMEKRLAKCTKMDEEMVVQECKETLTSRTVTLDEVKRNLEEWIPSLQAEYQSLLSHEAIRPISQQEYQDLHKTMEVTTIPGMVVSVIKPPYKLKSRFVACGNYVEVDPQDVPETAAGGLDAIVARVMVAMAARHHWTVSTADVRTAFLQAERRSTPGRVTVVTPPSLLKDTQILKEGSQEKWLIQKAIYGLIESPKDWADHRDAILQKVCWFDEATKKQRWIERTAENHLWQVRSDGVSDPIGFLGVYVDDLIVIGQDALVEQVMQNLMKVFTMAEPTKVTPEKCVSFCGYEIGMDENFNYTISQEKYVEELIKKYGLEGVEPQPIPKVVEGEDESPISTRALKAAQTIAGELLWVMTRSRPDICFAISLMTRLLHRRPSYVVELGKHVVKYLAGSRSMGLKFGSGMEGSQELFIKTDTSFAPPLEAYRSIQGTAIFHGEHLLQWSSGKQSFVTLSTAEAELVGYVDGFQQGQSMDGLLCIFGFSTHKRLQGDCKAALSQINSDATAWRTGHLRLRASRLRELVLDRNSMWDAEHVPGLELAPDGFTKVLIGQAFRRHRDQLGMCDVSESRQERLAEKINLRRIACDGGSGMLESLDVSQCLLGAGVALICTKHKLVGSLLLATAGMLCVSGRLGKESSRPAQNETRSQQELRERATPQKGSKDEAAHPPQKGIAGMAHGFLGDPRDHGRNEVGVDAPGFRASRMSSLSASHGVDEHEKGVGEFGFPRLMAFRAAGDPSRDQHPLPPPRNLALQRERDQAQSLGTSHGDLHRHFEIPQPQGVRVRQWWEDEKFDCWPVGQDKWIQTREGLLIRTHNKARRRSFHPLHRSLPVEVQDLRPERHTVIFPQDPTSQFVDPRPRFVEDDEWNGTNMWSKDFRWRGYTVFVLKSCNVDRPTPGHQAYLDPTLAAPRWNARSTSTGEQNHQYGNEAEVRGESASERDAAFGQAAASASSSGYGQDHGVQGQPMVQVNVNVYNTGGSSTPRRTPRTGAPESEDSNEFEFITP